MILKICERVKKVIMKKIICLLLVLVVCFSLCACYEKAIDENGVEINTFADNYGIISHNWEDNRYVAYVYDLQTKIVYIYREGFSPYQIYQDGVIYGAVYENGEIIPVPYAMGITWDMISLASKYLD